MTTKNLYQVLQVDPAASQEVIEAAYRRLAKKYHPDISPAPDTMRLMQDINEAFRVLHDPIERQRYDHTLCAAQSKQPYPSSNEQSSRGTQASSTRSWYEYPRSQTDTPPGFPTHCQKCGASDATLRLAVFPYVISIVILTFRRAWSGIYCARCSSQKMTEAKLLSLLFGWWGIPFGIIYTLGVLFKSSQGDVPPEANGPYLRALGAYFLKTGRIADAEQALTASLRFQYDQDIATTYRQIFGRDPDLKKHRGSGSGAIFGIAAVAGLIILVIVFSGAISPSNNPVATPPSVLPTSTTITVPTGWTPYRSEQVHFAGIVPAAYVSEEAPPSNDNPARSISFMPKTLVADSKIITVIAIPLPQTGRTRVPSQTELIQAANDWMKKNEVTVISPPAYMKHGGDVAVKMVHETLLSDSTYKIKAYAAMIAAPGWLYYIEVSGFSDQDAGIRAYFDIFLESFVSIR